MSFADLASVLPTFVPKTLQHTQEAVVAKTAIWTKLVDTGGSFVVNLGVAIVILVVTIWLSGWVAKLTRNGIVRMHRHKRPDPTVAIFFSSVARNAVIIIGLIAVLQQLGVRTTSIIAVLGAASLAIGLALQGALANVAAGVMLLLFRPYRVGERVNIAGKDGTVRALDLFMTEITDGDNVRVMVPNSKAFGEVITNFSRLDHRRVEINVGIDYDDDVELALALLIEIAKADKRVREDPHPWAKVTALGDSTVTVTLRAWVASGDWWDARFDLLKDVKQRFEAAGLHFPYPHQVGLSREEAMGKRADPPPPAELPAPRARFRSSAGIG